MKIFKYNLSVGMSSLEQPLFLSVGIVPLKYNEIIPTCGLNVTKISREKVYVIYSSEQIHLAVAFLE